MQWEVEALDPAELQRPVLAAGAPYVDQPVLDAHITEEEFQRGRLRAFTEEWPAWHPRGSVDLVVAGAHTHAAGQQPVKARVALQVEPDALRGGCTYWISKENSKKCRWELWIQ
ncbi:hypothetical protein OG373_02665 [Streptomyces avidinii]|uniref:hypothetical protein n=1 Tax=Streptomyces avidinii TaxID=1895 RepID=UPI003870AF70|nr:hypothetical protein OG373_02665 [Streptomyces avidinii]